RVMLPPHPNPLLEGEGGSESPPVFFLDRLGHTGASYGSYWEDLTMKRPATRPRRQEATSLPTPLDLVRAVGGSLRAIVEFPATLQQTMRETTALIADARKQLALLGEQIRRMMEQLDKMAMVSDRLIEGARSIAETGQGAQHQLARTTEHLAAASRSLDQIVRLAEPLDRMGKRVADGFLRATGRRGTPSQGT